jgi:hypothetical protein
MNKSQRRADCDKGYGRTVEEIVMEDGQQGVKIKEISWPNAMDVEGGGGGGVRCG